MKKPQEGSPRAESAEEEGILEILSGASSQRREGIVVGSLVALDGMGEPRVDFPGRGDAEPVRARTLVPLEPAQVGREVALMFEEGDPERPVLLGVVQQPVDLLLSPDATAEAERPAEAVVDEERVVLEAHREIVLRCGKASITLTPDGRIRIRGTDLLSRSSGGHRIKGASVSIN